MKTAIIIFPGSNCDNEMERFLLSIFDTVPTRVWHKEQELPDADLYVLPGGFSYGDYIRSGALASMSPLMKDLKKASFLGKKILGVCNGFQILCELGLLPGTLRINESGKFICKPVEIWDKITDDRLTIPIAHGEGNYHILPDDLKEENIAFEYDENVNGSYENIAGMLNDRKNVLGMMPHPERAFEKYHVSQDGPKSIWQMLI
jgi:phosphoribosylformylglycinamidine synthase